LPPDAFAGAAAPGSRRRFLGALACALIAPPGTGAALAQTAAQLPPSSAVTAIDCHAHVFLRTLQWAAGARFNPAYDASGDIYQAILNAFGISHAVLPQVSALGHDDSYLMQVVSQSGGRLKAAPWLAETTTYDEMQALKAQGAVGIRLPLLEYPIPDFSTGRAREFVDAAVATGLNFDLYVEVARLEQLLRPLVDAGARVVVAHCGLPAHKIGIEERGFTAMLDLAASRRVWVKLSGVDRIGEPTWHAAADVLRERLGLARLVWGSDWPYTRIENKANYLHAYNAITTYLRTPADRDAVLRDTPKALYHFA
jgi:predicted TIM-barrel fold metal-dependent hydrolase